MSENIRLMTQSSNLNDEYNCIQIQSGLLNLSQTGIFLLRGKKVKDQLQSLVPMDLHRIGPGESCQTTILNETGGIQSRVTIHDRGQTGQLRELILIINDLCTTVQMNYLWKKLESEHSLTISDLRKDCFYFALEGLMAKRYLQEVTNTKEILLMAPFSNGVLYLNGISDSIAHGAPILLMRISSIGGDGFQILLKRDVGIRLWRNLLLRGCKPCSLAVRDVLRLENHFQIYGSDFDHTTSPFEASLGQLVHLEIPEHFSGRRALETQTAAHIYYQLVGLIIEGPIIPNHYCFVVHNGVRVGQVTSGGWSPTLSQPIALAYLSTEVIKRQEYVTICISNKNYTARVMKIPFN
uniref:Putative Glycine cleavage T-protein n=1 Tax=Paulinella micropora TaxID=1928728 RepID=A0A385I072_9EUKA|nr:putative Glycine cleavage T-protein [Paulinella micropora]AXY63323.1 putative Glycine cleavage T-protein [Paulinella micropora]